LLNSNPILLVRSPRSRVRENWVIQARSGPRRENAALARYLQRPRFYTRSFFPKNRTKFSATTSLNSSNPIPRKAASPA